MRLINGVGLGFEIYDNEAMSQIYPDAKWGLMFDLVIFHIIIAKL